LFGVDFFLSFCAGMDRRYFVERQFARERYLVVASRHLGRVSVWDAVVLCEIVSCGSDVWDYTVGERFVVA